MFKGFQVAPKVSSMMPGNAILSEAYKPDCCSFSRLAVTELYSQNSFRAKLVFSRRSFHQDSVLSLSKYMKNFRLFISGTIKTLPSLFFFSSFILFSKILSFLPHCYLRKLHLHKSILIKIQRIITIPLRKVFHEVSIDCLCSRNVVSA